MQLFQQIAQQSQPSGGGKHEHAPDTDLHKKVDELQQQMGALMNAMGASAGPQQVGAGQPSNVPADAGQIQDAMPKQASTDNGKRRRILDSLSRQSVARR